MRIAAALVAGFLGFVANVAQAMTFEEARHLLARTGFAAPTLAEIEAIRSEDYGRAVDRMLAGARTAAVTRPPEWTSKPPTFAAKGRPQSDAEKKARRQEMREHAIDLKAWWLMEMTATPTPLTERMALFWHNHFTSSLQKVRSPELMFRQNQIFRRHGLGNFSVMLSQVAKDPAMLIYLDGRQNRAGQPNENFARELLELFALGEGKGYTESDIREAARAFTGWTIDPKTGDFAFNRRQHDGGTKTFLGRTGRFTGDDILRIVLDHPRAGEHIAEKLWREFVSDAPDPADIRHLAGVFRKFGYEIKPLMRAVLTRAQFRDAANRGALVKSPVDMVVGTMRLAGIRPEDGRGLVQATRALGQDVFDPPNVKGWPGGTAWITAASLQARERFLRRVSRGAEMAMNGKGGKNRDMARDKGMSAAMDGGLPARVGGDAETMAKVVLALAPLEPPLDRMATVDALRHLLLDPAYQVK